MAIHNQKGNKRQAGQESAQDLANQSFDPAFGTFVQQVVGSPDGVNLYKLAVNSSGALPVVNLDGSAIGGAGGTLPLGAATETTLAAIKAKTDNLDVLLSTRTKPADAQHVIVDSGVTTGLTDTQLRATPVPVSNTSLPLPTGASTSANQTTQNTSLSNIDTKTPALGQALAGASTPVVLPAAQITSLTPLSSVGVNNFPATQAVSIASMPSTPVTGPLTDTQLRATAVPVSLATNTPTLQTGANIVGKVGIDQTTDGTTNKVFVGNIPHVIVDSAPASGGGTQYADGAAQATPTGTQANWNEAGTQRATSLAKPLPIQAGTGVTIPVSLASAPTTPVTGTFFQATQPVSLATNTPDVTDRAGRLLGSIANTAFTANAGTNLNTSLLALDSTVAKDASLTTLNTSVNTLLKPASTLAAVTTVGAVTAITNALPAGTNAIGTTLGPTLTKGTQGVTGYSVQDLKDSGRVNILWTAEFAAVAVAETLLTLTESRDGAAVTTFTTKVVTTGKRLRITSISMAVESGGSTGTAIQRAILRMRYNTAGAVTTASPLQGVWQAATAAALKATGSVFADFPDGIEFLGDGTKQIGFTLTNPDWVVTTSIPTTRVTIFGYEY